MCCVYSIRFTIHIATVNYQYKSSLCYLNKNLLMFISWYCTFIYKKYVVLSCFIFNRHKTLLVSQIIITTLCLSQKFRIKSFVIFSNTIFCCIQLNIIPSNSFDCPNSANIERRPHSKRWKTDLYQRLADRGGVYCDSDLNHLSSVILR